MHNDRLSRCTGVVLVQMGLPRMEDPWSVPNQSPTKKPTRTPKKASGLTQSGSATTTRALSTLRGQGEKGSQGYHQEVTPLAGLL
jgi:hypothetical protein